MFSFQKNKRVKPLDKKLLFFIGSPRTGSTLLGQVINYHPNCLVANEFRLLNKIIIDKKSINKSLNSLEKYAKKQFNSGLENDKKYKKTMNNYQSKWQGFEHFTSEDEFKKKEIQLLGDKKAGGNIQVISDYTQVALNFFETVPQLYFIQIIRNPIDAAISLLKSHNFTNFDDAIKHIIQQTYKSVKFSKEHPYNCYTIYYEDLMETSQLEVKNIFDWLGLEVSNKWLSQICQVISKSEEKEVPQHYFDIYQKEVSNYEEIDVFNKYQLK